MPQPILQLKQMLDQLVGRTPLKYVWLNTHRRVNPMGWQITGWTDRGPTVNIWFQSDCLTEVSRVVLDQLSCWGGCTQREPGLEMWELSWDHVPALHRMVMRSTECTAERAILD